ncbi:Uncharacterized protein GBIM_17421 [Gryllus bimaculatus]|nr:Uncharacterized protein GBIM_17421 [Gryllus bimaculatus]
MHTNFEQYSTIKKEVDIKKEPMTVNDIVLPLNENSRDILMDYGMNRKKVVHLDGSNSLFTECKKHVCSDPALLDLLTDSYPVFQEFTAKFNTWVDIECENNLRDGTVVKVMFFPKVIETDVLNPGSIKRKRDNDDNEANPKQHRILEDNFRKKSNSLIRCDENRGGDVENGRNDVIYVDSKKRSDIRPSFNTQGCNGKPVHHATTPTPVAKRDQSSLLPKTIKADVHVTSTNVQPQNLEEVEKSDLHPDFHDLPSYTVEQATGVVLPERQILNERIPPIQLTNEEHSKKKKQNKKKVTPSRVQSCKIENRKGNSSQSRAVNVVPASQALLIEEKPLASRPQKSTPKPEVCKRSIAWKYSFPRISLSKRQSWAGKNMDRIWFNTLFSDFASFGLEGNCIKFFNYHFREDCELFWGFRSFDGPNIIAPLGCGPLRGLKPGEVLINKVIRPVKDHYKSSDVTLQSPVIKNVCLENLLEVLNMNFIFFSGQPPYVQDLSPAYHAWKLVGEKVKNIQCSSKQEMISIVSGVWENDLEIQLMCSEMISLLPKIIKSVVKRKGRYPLIKVHYVVSS